MCDTVVQFEIIIVFITIRTMKIFPPLLTRTMELHLVSLVRIHLLVREEDPVTLNRGRVLICITILREGDARSIATNTTITIRDEEEHNVLACILLQGTHRDGVLSVLNVPCSVCFDNSRPVDLTTISISNTDTPTVLIPSRSSLHTVLNSERDISVSRNGVCLSLAIKLRRRHAALHLHNRILVISCSTRSRSGATNKQRSITVATITISETKFLTIVLHTKTWFESSVINIDSLTSSDTQSNTFAPLLPLSSDSLSLSEVNRIEGHTRVTRIIIPLHVDFQLTTTITTNNNVSTAVEGRTDLCLTTVVVTMQFLNPLTF